ncbi:DHA1 family putative efflux transporter-like MFS transporter [Paenibacillus sp. W2I17]|nr:DHA1 family putative efflux transporter-like MFS transporter [Paenibacillus sp. W2I17]
MISNTWKIYMLAIVSFLVGTSELIIAGILDKVAASIGVPVSVAGQLITVFSLAYAFGTPVIMALTSRMDRRNLLIYSLVAFVIGNAMTAVLPGFLLLFISRIVLALSTGVFIVTALMVASKLAPPDKQGSGIATVVMGFSTALVVGVPLGRVAASMYDWKLIFAGLGVLGLLAIFGMYSLIPKSEGEEPVPIGKQLALLKEPRIAMALLITFFWIAGYSIVYTYISPFLLSVTGMSEKIVSIGLFAFGIASLLGSKFGGYSSDKWGVSRTLIGSLLVHALALILIFIGAMSPIVMFPLLMLWSFAAWTSGPTTQYNLVQQAPEASGIMLSLNNSVVQLAMAFGAGLGGVVVEQISLSSISWIGAIIVFLGVITTVASSRFSRSEALDKG